MLDKAISLLLLGGANTIGALERLFDLEAPGRALKNSEIGELQRVFIDSINYQSVTLKVGNSHLLTLPHRAFVLANTIYIPEIDFPLDLLVHEMTHVWQHQHGGVQYISKALWAQFFGQGYDFPLGIAQGREWAELNPEQQAELIQQAYRAGYFHLGEQQFIYQAQDYSEYLQRAVRYLRAGQGAP
jgi:hypothetical protein